MENIERSLNFELIEGATDAVIKKGSPDRGGHVEGTTAAGRRALSALFQGTGEAYAHEVIKGVVRGT